MSQLDVHEIICPIIEQERDQLRRDLHQAERIVLLLRKQLITTDTSLPNEYDGTAWHTIEAAHLTPSDR